MQATAASAQNSQASTGLPEGRRRLAKIASAIANPTSAPTLARLVSSRRREAPGARSSRQAGRSASQSERHHSRSCSGKGMLPAGTVKYTGTAILWMKRPSVPLEGGRPDEDSCQLSHTRLDLQTNNSKKEGSPESRRKPAANESSDYEVVSELSEHSSDWPSLENTSAVAKGADAMVKMSLSRPTEIIDTSKLIEEGKVETEYIEDPEIIEEQDHAMVDEYEKSFAYARRLRALLNMDFKEVDKGTIETNFLLVKAHEHPTQKMIDRWRNVDLGVSYNDQVKRLKQIEDYRANAVKKKGKKDETEPAYPEMIRFTVRFRKENSEKKWKDYMAFRQKQKKQAGNKGGGGAVPKPNDKYVFAFQDLWSYCVVVFVKPSATVREIVDPVFARLGLERRADFTYTIGCFNNDKRAGKAKILGVPNLPEPLEMYQLASELYKKNCTEIYVNDNRCELFSIFPDYYARGMPKKAGEEAKAPDAKGKKKKDKNKGKDKGKDGAAAGGNKPKEGQNKNKSNVQLLAQTDDSDSTTATPGGGTPSLRRRALLGDEAAAFEASSSEELSSTPEPLRRRGGDRSGRRLTVMAEETSSQ